MFGIRHAWVFWFMIMAFAWSVSIPRVVLCPSSFYTSSLGASWVLPPPSRSNVLYNYDDCDFLTILFHIFWFQRLVFIFVLLQGHVCEAGPLDALFRAPCRKLGTLCPPIMAKKPQRAEQVGISRNIRALRVAFVFVEF